MPTKFSLSAARIFVRKESQPGLELAIQEYRCVSRHPGNHRGDGLLIFLLRTSRTEYNSSTLISTIQLVLCMLGETGRDMKAK